MEHEILKVFFQDLSADELLSKCLHGRTSHRKISFVNREVLGINSVIEFNYGLFVLYEILKQFGKMKKGEQII